MLKLFHLILIVSCLSACLGDTNVNIDPQPRPDEPTVAPNSTTAAPTTPTTTTSKPTPAPTTTTTTTTPKPTPPPTTTTTPPSTTTTTPKPTPPPTTTSTAAPITTTVKPTPTPEPTADTWSLTQNNVTCIIAHMALQANVTYFTSTGANNTVLVNLPPKNKTTVSGNCEGKNWQNIVITWGNNSLSMNFTRDDTKQFMVNQINLKIASKGFPDSNGTDIVAYLNKTEFITPLNMSYKCDRDEMLTLTRTLGGNDTIATVTVRHLQIEAFHVTNSTKFSTVSECWTPTSDIVPVAVGCALAGLIIIILVGYLIGRRRATARGYLSM